MPTRGGRAYVGNDYAYFYVLDAWDLSLVASCQTGGIVCSSPAVAYNVDADHNRWVYVTTRADGGKLLAFKFERQWYGRAIGMI